MLVCYVCVLVVSLCASRRKVDLSFSKIQIKQLKHHVILIPISQRLFNLHMAFRSGLRASDNRTPAAAGAGGQPNGQNPLQEEQEVSQNGGGNQGEVPLPPPPPFGDLA